MSAAAPDPQQSGSGASDDTDKVSLVLKVFDKEEWQAMTSVERYAVIKSNRAYRHSPDTPPLTGDQGCQLIRMLKWHMDIVRVEKIEEMVEYFSTYYPDEDWRARLAKLSTMELLRM
ncbi:hypothetical protein KIPB_005210 [Kipferlia bialata]|uniref:Uncharacterized protein n=1 Tax=Kipferlia bialata TaxID=797122 RepID=A0A9K3CWP3_9EUKA|nr:hypothetical protein KIPB_005210 [Kipferlia bialata]|eukprot:g5210.t1